MASSLLALLDDVATLTKIATKKTAGVLGDDLALNAQQVTGVHPERELPVVWAVAKGSAINKVILVPAAVAISAFLPWAIVPLLMIGGVFLCFEGFEKVAHKLLHSKAEDKKHEEDLEQAITQDVPQVDLMTLEKDKIKGAIRTDFILSAEIIVISLGTVTAASLGMRFAVLAAISLIMTVGVYGLVAGIVKLDDLGVHMASRAQPQRSIGRGILWFAPVLMTLLSFFGTAAMFLVGGGIISHGIPAVEHWISAVAKASGVFEVVVPMALNGLLGVIAGGLAVAIVVPVGKLINTWRRSKVTS